MTSLKQIEANRLNALKSTGPRSDLGKQRSKLNAVSHGLTAETVVLAFENIDDYKAFEDKIAADYDVRSTVDRELISRLASVLWRLRRSTSIETGMLQLQAELMAKDDERSQRGRRVDQPGWYSEFDVGSPPIANYMADFDTPEVRSTKTSNFSKELACCFLRVSRLQYGTFELFTRYETALWRQAAQLVIMLDRKMRSV